MFKLTKNGSTYLRTYLGEWIFSWFIFQLLNSLYLAMIDFCEDVAKTNFLGCLTSRAPTCTIHDGCKYVIWIHLL